MPVTSLPPAQDTELALSVERAFRESLVTDRLGARYVVYDADRSRERAFIDLVLGYRQRLATVFASAAPPAPKAADAALCKDTGRWLLTGGKRLQPTLPAGPLSEAASSEVVLLGEQHDQDDHHRWQLQVLAALHAQRPDMVIGFEMFPRRLQPVLDRWVAGQLSVREFITQAEWEQVWNFPPQLYLPLFEFARINRIPMIALNVDQKLTRAIADKGWQGVPATEREGVGRPAAALPRVKAVTWSISC